MYCTKRIQQDLFWIGGNDRRLSLFEGVYSVPKGVSYNSYILLDDKIVIFDTVDKAIGEIYFENLEYKLQDRNPDYIVVQHMEPDHSATLKRLIQLYPNITIVCNSKTQNMINQFFEFKQEIKYHIVQEGDVLETGHHILNFIMAPMVHWPEVMVVYDSEDKILFSADAFGTFGALNGAIFADEVDFEHDYMDEARRYYTNIVGKYGVQVQTLLKKVSNFDIKCICPLHGFVWRNNLNDYIDKYHRWSTYTPEEQGVMIAYASVYGNTANVADIISAKLWDKGIKTVMFDVSVTPASEIVSASFKWSHLLFASTTYNAGIFISMEEVLRDLVSHNIQKRTVAFIENGSWVATSGKLMKELLSECKEMNYIENFLSIKSSLKNNQMEDVENLVNAICNTF
ncbi:MAG: FprA family A-type flavoprotein [bacterium]|nr:FprA family A-type flavoprotein [bacterium]